MKKLFGDIPKTDKVIVLDIDETALNTKNCKNGYINMKLFTGKESLSYRDRVYRFVLEDYDDVGSGKNEQCWGIERPYIHEFIAFCFNYFKYVVVWSAGQRSYVHTVVDILFRHHQRPHLILTYDDLVVINGEKTKPLSLVSRLTGVSLSKIWLLDDRAENFIDNPQNGILILEYNPPGTHESFIKDDQALPSLMKWLNRPEVMKAEDIKTLDTSNIF
uniref:Ctd-like (NLI interacting factor-like) phosphatase n=1 Tax=Pithovirus LCPAC403 TaxID=2506596 RepID=A0A481ZEP5_9VIRU|nr:MAG: ctd-like (NLI interacting factor-like) phosphatase [Pithovirus LCPAC403]